jgi:hypothetical protein
MKLSLMIVLSRVKARRGRWSPGPRRTLQIARRRFIDSNAPFFFQRHRISSTSALRKHLPANERTVAARVLGCPFAMAEFRTNGGQKRVGMCFAPNLPNPMTKNHSKMTKNEI